MSALLSAVVLLAACAAPTPAAPTAGLASQAQTPEPARGTAAPTLMSPPGKPATPRSRASADGLSDEQRAAFAEARLLLVEGDYAAAAERWRALLSFAPLAADARFYLALSLAQGKQSIEDLTAATSNPAVAPAVWLEVAERELDARRFHESADAASKGLDSAQNRPLKQRLLEIRAQALGALGDNESAFDAHRQVLTLATNRATLGEQLFRLAQASRDLGKRDAALQALKTALDQFPSASTTADALRLLDDLGAASEVDPFVLGRARYFAIDYRNAVSAFDRYLKADPTGPDVPAARLYRALASLTPGNEPNALRELDALADDPNQDTELAAQALVEAGQALEGLAEPDQAETRYARLLQKFPRLDAAATAAFRLGLVRYTRGADAEAVAAWDDLLTRRDNLTPEDTSRALYWRGKAQARLGRDSDARHSWEEAAAVRPATFYPLRALFSLSPSPVASIPAGVTPDDERQLTQWMVGRNLDLSAAADVVAQDPALTRAVAEASLGLFREGNWEADELLQRYPDRADRLYVLARRFADLGLVGGATRLGQAAYAAAGLQTPQDAPAALLKMAFPRPFANLTDAAATGYGVDQLLLESTLRDASQFDAWSENAASGARGLAQMSPVRIDEASHALRTTAEADVFRPKTAVDLHSWMLADRLRRFDGRPEAALSAIATTDRLVDGWLARPGAQDPEVFLESIDFEGVRASLRGVLATRLSYALTYLRPDGSHTSGDPLGRVQVKREPTATWIKIARLASDVPADAPLSPPPPPTIGDADQQQAFARGGTLQRDGDFDAAAEIFRGLSSSPEAAVAAEGRLRLGQALLGGGRAAEAIEPLQAVDAAQAGSVAAFLLGRAEADLNHCQLAVGHLERFINANPGPLAAQARSRQASCLADLGRGGEGTSLLEQAAATPDLSRLQTVDFREQLALTRLRAGDVDGARADYEALLSEARSNSYRAELSYYLGELAPDPSSAAARFRSTIQLEPKGRAAQAALDQLVALQDAFAGSFEAGETRFEQNRYREAVAAYTGFLQQQPSDPRAAKAVYGWGVSLVRLGQDRAGIAVLEQMPERFPGTVDAADGLFRGGRIRESLADLDGATQAYRGVASMPGAGSRAADAQFRLAFVQYRQGSVRQATEGWRDLAGRANAPEDRAQAFFWLGKALESAGDKRGAEAAWIAARDRDPRGFYGLRGADRLTGLGDPQAQVDRTLPLVLARATEDQRAWSTSGSTPGNDPGVPRAETLIAMGLRQQAIWELGAVKARLGGNTDSVAALGAWEQQRGLYNTALALGYDLASMLKVSPTNGPAVVRRLLYPLPHPSVLTQAAQRLRVDPLLFSALMRQESNMDQAVESAAQARGLSQMLASTGYEAARALGQYGFRGTDLFRPKTSITLGAFTLGQRLNRYDQRIFPALAAYNAAQFAVDGWLLAASTEDIDTFAEAIPFTETYPYVQHIYENYQQYLELYDPQRS